MNENDDLSKKADVLAYLYVHPNGDKFCTIPGESTWQDEDRIESKQRGYIEIPLVSSNEESIIEAIMLVVGDDIKNKSEARERFLEESLELVQAAEGSIEEVKWCADKVFSKKADPVKLEIGQVSTALHRLAFSYGFSVTAEMENNRQYIVSNVEYIRERHKKKIRFSSKKQIITIPTYRYPQQLITIIPLMKT